MFFASKWKKYKLFNGIDNFYYIIDILFTRILISGRKTSVNQHSVFIPKEYKLDNKTHTVKRIKQIMF